MQQRLSELSAILEKIQIATKFYNRPNKNRILFDEVDPKGLHFKTLADKEAEFSELEDELKSAFAARESDLLCEIESQRLAILALETQVNLQGQQIVELQGSEKKLRSENLDLKGSIRTYCRIKPANKINIAYSERKVEIDGKAFRVEKVYRQDSGQKDIFAEMECFIDNVMDGYKVCIFAYGQTGSGKTYTMEGNRDGLIFSSLQKIGTSCDLLRAKGFAISFGLRYLEIYNENAIDLFTNETVSVVHDKQKISLKNCSEKVAGDIGSIMSYIEDAKESRVVAETACNAKSSRSHAILMLRIRMESEHESREGVLSLVDLAGSERLSESKAENQRLKETQNINKSLSALGNVFNAIKRQDKHIPFRDSKLTHVMQDYLSGQSRVIMIVNINPENVNESICSLRFASKVSECTLGPVERNVRIRN